MGFFFLDHSYRDLPEPLASCPALATIFNARNPLSQDATRTAHGAAAGLMKKLDFLSLFDDAQVVILNMYSHIWKQLIEPISTCIKGTKQIRWQLAAAVGLRLWEHNIAAIASALSEVSATKKIYYLLSATPGAFTCQAAQGLRTDRPLRQQELEQLTRAWFERHPGTRLSGGSCSPPFDSSMPYQHQLYRTVNDLSARAFLKANLSVIDLEVMQGVRVDAHPALETQSCNLNSTRSGENDHLHWCMPGVPDWVLDTVLLATAR